MSGCAPFPQIAQVDGSVGPFPDLVPVEQLLEQAPTGGPPPTADITARIATLRARAARLRGPVIEPAIRARMQAGIARSLR